MARIECTRLNHRYPGHERAALRLGDHVWEDGGAHALLGPSGCGKTTLLNILSGLIVPTEGRVTFDGVDVTVVPTARRNIAQVFQVPLVYTALTVFENLAFPLRNRRLPEAQVARRVHRVAQLLELGGLLSRHAHGLELDAKQSIALGRALVRDDVAAILLDEPLTAIDPRHKWQLRRKLREIHRECKVTMIYVTHDQTEALTFADRVAVMHAGRIVECGTPQELFERPAHAFVGHFIGSPGMNLLPCTIGRDGAWVAEQWVGLVPGHAARIRQARGELLLGIRPEFVALTDPCVPGSVHAQVTAVQDLGECRIVTAQLGEHTFRARLEDSSPPVLGRAWFAFPPESIRMYADGRIVP